MADQKEKDTQLEEILSEINEGIKSDKKPKAQAKKKNDEAKPASPKTAKPKVTKPKKEAKPKVSYDGADQMSFAKAATIIEDAMGNNEVRGKETEDPENDNHSHHIAVTYGETVELPEETKKVAEKTEPVKKPSKSELRKINGTAVSRPKRDKPTTRQRRTMVLGIFLSFFVLVGLFSTVWVVASATGNLINASSLKSELARVVFPLVIIDTPEFDTPTKLDNSAMISSAIWAFVIDDKDKSEYRTDDLGSIYVPDTDIDLYVRQLFGPEAKVTHQSIDDAGIQMAYSPESKTYIIEPTPKSLPYTPRVDSVKKTGDIYILEVGYILPTVLWNLENDISKSPADKIMEYTLLKKDKTYQITSVKLLSISSLPEGSRQDNSMNEEYNPEDDPFLGDEFLPEDDGLGEGIPEDIPQGDATQSDATSDISSENSSSEASDDTASKATVE